MTGTAAAGEQETLIPYMVPPRTPMTPEQVDRAFAYLRALEAAVADREQADPELPFLMFRLTEDLVLPVTTVPDDEDPTADSFVLEQVGDVLLSALRDWQRDSPAIAFIGLARSFLCFITHILADQDGRRRRRPSWNGCETSTRPWPGPPSEAGPPGTYVRCWS